MNDGKATLVLPDGERHESRTTTLIAGPDDKAFWVNLIVACDGPKMGARGPEGAGLVLRDYAKLENAKNDLNAFYSYYRPIRLGSPDLICPLGVGRSPGFFDKTVGLDNPSRNDLFAAVSALRDWIRVNRRDPEYGSVQLNFLFAGHGYLDPTSETSGIVIADGELTASTLAELLADIVAGSEVEDEVPRIDLFLDCCHSGGIARDVTRRLLKSQREEAFAHRIGRIYCSCLDDESSFELARIQHGIFTFAFLNEYSRLRPEGAQRINVALRDVGWVTRGGQHPFLIDFVSSGKGSAFKIPSAKNIDKELVGSVLVEARDEAIGQLLQDGRAPIAEDGVAEVAPVDLALEMTRRVRAHCEDIESRIFRDRSRRSRFMREELWAQTGRWS
jgi:hypothetical protein